MLLAPSEFLYPAVLFLAIPAAIILLWLARASFVRDNPRYDDAQSIRRRSKLRWTVFVLRLLAVVLLCIALATPLTKQNIVRAGDTHITVLVDNSSSMAVLDTDFLPSLLSQLRADVPVTVVSFAEGETSALGDGVLDHLKPNENILLVTDGYSTGGVPLGDVAAFARQRNSTISALHLSARVTDAGVSVAAPEKAIAGTNVTLTISVARTEDSPVKVQVLIDGAEVYNQASKTTTIPITREYAAGKHTITARLLDEDANLLNNEYNAYLTVVEKPRILVVSQKTNGLVPLLQQLYSVTLATGTPTDLDALKPYYAVVLVDQPVSSLGRSTDALRGYLQDGNGLFVVGGPHSYDYGGYQNSLFESLLPVSVGKGKDREGVTNIVIAIDMSGSVGGGYTYDPTTGQLRYQASDKPALIRSLALSVLEDIDRNNNVGIVVIGGASENASENIRGQGNLIYWDYVGGRDLGRVSTLGPKRDQLMNAVSRVQGGGQAPSEYWLGAPLKALEGVAGSKNIIVITDGQSCTQNCVGAQGGSDEEATTNIASTIAAQGGKVYTVGVEQNLNEDFLQRLSQAGNGIYFAASQKNKLRILFGDPSKNEGADAFGLVVLNQNHFITRDVPLQATLYGYNEVVPKGYASLLVTAGNGKPALTVWNYGVGRVASLTAYNGDDYGELLAKGNSLLLSRTGNWLVGDPERKAESTLSVPQMHVGEVAVISVRSEKIPVNDELEFVPRGKDVFTAAYTPEKAGFGSVGGIPYAASYASEYEHVGMNPKLESTLAVSGGKIFEPDDAQTIIEHAQTVRALQETDRTPLRAPFIIAAAIIFLLEIAVRRLYELLRARSA